MNWQRAGVFTVDERNHIRDRILELANLDDRIVAGAVVGSLATNEGDRWSDLDLTFGVVPENQIGDVLDRLTAPLVSEFEAVHLFDLPHRESIFRVLLLQGCLQVDLSVTPASKFGPNGPKFRILFGRYTENPLIPAPLVGQLIGYAAHHAARARFCIERGRFWQAEYWIKRRTRLHSQPCLPSAQFVSPLRPRLRPAPCRNSNTSQGFPGQVLGSWRATTRSGIRSRSAPGESSPSQRQSSRS